MAGAECVIQQWCSSAGCWGHQNRPLSHCAIGRAPRVCADAVHLPDRLHPGEFSAGFGAGQGGHGCLGTHVMCHPSVVQVREQDLSVVIHTLSQEFDIYREVGGEPVPVPRDDSSNGFPRSQHGEATF